MRISTPTRSHRRTNRRLAATVFTLAASLFLAGCESDVEFTRRPVEQAQTGDRPAVRSPVFVVARSDAAPLRAAVAAGIPKRLLRVSRWVSKAACVEKNGRRRCASARVKGDITRTGDVSLLGTSTGFTLQIPVSYEFEVRGGGVARSLETTVAGKFVIKAPFTVSLDGTWQPGVRFAGDLTMEGARAIPIMEKSLNVADQIARKLRRPLARLARAFEGTLDTTEAIRIVEKTWRHLHYPVQLRKEPPLWLRGDPESIAFGGLGIRGDEIELRIAILGKVATFAGERPVPLIARTMPELDTTPIAVAESHLIMPVDLPYGEIASRIKDALDTAGPIVANQSSKAKSFVVTGVTLFPSNGRLTMAIGLEADIEGNWQKLTGTAYMMGTPAVRKGATNLTLKLVEFSAPTPSPALFDEGRFILPEKPFAAAFRKGLELDIKERFASVLDGINRVTQADFAENNRIRGRFDELKVHSIEVHEGNLRINLDLVGALSVYPGSAKVAAGLGTVEPSSSAQ